MKTAIFAGQRRVFEVAIHRIELCPIVPPLTRAGDDFYSINETRKLFAELILSNSSRPDLHYPNFTSTQQLVRGAVCAFSSLRPGLTIGSIYRTWTIERRRPVEQQFAAIYDT